MSIQKLVKLRSSSGRIHRGHGMMSGVIALVLAILCFLGVLAFHFPQYLHTRAAPDV